MSDTVPGATRRLVSKAELGAIYRIRKGLIDSWIQKGWLTPANGLVRLGPRIIRIDLDLFERHGVQKPAPDSCG